MEDWDDDKEELASSQHHNLKCSSCGGKSFYEDDSERFVCSDCGVQSQDIFLTSTENIYEGYKRTRTRASSQSQLGFIRMQNL